MLSREPGGSLRASAGPGSVGGVRPSSAHGASPCRAVPGEDPAIADRRGSRLAPRARPSPSHLVHPFVPSVVRAVTPPPASSPFEDLGARGGQALPLLLPASRNLFTAPSRTEERSLGAFIEALL
jgi:hypothetical protein